MTDGASSSKLRLSAVRANGRLLKGYGPLAALLVAFVLMAMLVPTKAPQQEVLHETQTVHTAGGGDAAATGGTGTTAGATGSAGTTSHGSTTTGGTAGAKTTAGATAATPATGKTGACAGQAAQVPGDPYSPPCITFSGSNGGATSPGVSANAINVTYRFTSDSQSFQQTLASLGGANIVDTNADIERTINALATYFDNHFQFYGRKLNVEFFNGQGSITDEPSGAANNRPTRMPSRPPSRSMPSPSSTRPRSPTVWRCRSSTSSTSASPICRPASWGSTPRTCGASTPSPTTSSKPPASST